MVSTDDAESVSVEAATASVAMCQARPCVMPSCHALHADPLTEGALRKALSWSRQVIDQGREMN